MAEIAAALPTAGGIYYCEYWERNFFPILNSLRIFSRDHVPPLTPETIFIGQLLTPPLPRVVRLGGPKWGYEILNEVETYFTDSDAGHFYHG